LARLFDVSSQKFCRIRAIAALQSVQDFEVFTTLQRKAAPINGDMVFDETPHTVYAFESIEEKWIV
jgi:hypothetical protein